VSGQKPVLESQSTDHDANVIKRRQVAGQDISYATRLNARIVKR